jgi:drug/metabolite transporter (DMT)-like permease
MILGYLSSLVFVFFLAISVFCFGYASRISSPFHVLFVETTISVVLILVLMLATEKISFAQVFTIPRKTNWLWLSMAGTSGFIGGNYFSYLNLKTAGEKINGLLSPAITAVALVFGYFIFHDQLDWLQWLGAIITILAVSAFLYYNADSGEDKTNSRLGALSGVACVIFMSVSIVGAIRGAAGVSILHAMWLQLFVAMVCITPGYLFNKRPFKIENRPKFYLAILAGVLTENIVAGYIWYFATYRIGVSIFQTIIATLPLCVYAIDRIFFKRKSGSAFFILACIISLIGIGLVMLA